MPHAPALDTPPHRSAVEPRVLDVVVAGAGLIGRRHMALIGASDTCRLAAIVDPALAARQLAAESGVPWFASLEAMFAAALPDGVILATPNALHVDGAQACIRAGVPALVEKPVAHSLEAGLALCEAAENAGARLLVGHHRAHSPIVARARAIVQSGQLGALVAVTGTALFCKPDDYFDAARWRREPGGGPILINMIHEVGNLRAICGANCGEIVSVQAMASHAARGFAVEDTVAINLRFASGALGTFLLSDAAASPRSWEQTSREDPNYPTYPDEDCYVIAGTLGSLSVPTMRLKTYANHRARSWWKPFDTAVAALDRADPLACQLAHFCDVIRGNATPLVTVRDGVRNLRITEAIAQAARTGEVIDTAP